MSQRLRPAWTLLAASWAALLLFLGSRTGAALPDSRLLDLPGADKLLHGIAYGVLGALAAKASSPRSTGRALLLGALTGLIWGMLDEWVQGRVPGRTRSWADLLADTAGATCGGFLGRSRQDAPSATMPGPLSRGEP